MQFLFGLVVITHLFCWETTAPRSFLSSVPHFVALEHLFPLQHVAWCKVSCTTVTHARHNCVEKRRVVALGVLPSLQNPAVFVSRTSSPSLPSLIVLFLCRFCFGRALTSVNTKLSTSLTRKKLCFLTNLHFGTLQSAMGEG